MNKENWNHLSISECADVIGGGTPSTKNPDYWDGNIPWIAPKDLSNNKDKYISNGERFITQLGLEKSSAKLLPENSLLFSSRAPIGYLAINTKPVATNQGFKSLILKDGFDVEFFYYLFKNKTEYIKSFASGSTFQEVSGSVVKNLSFLIPPKQEQKRISNILSKLDSKIELNQKMNENLEEIAKTLFKSWFIDFDPVKAKAEGKPTGLSQEISDLFPDSFEDSELGQIPKGFKVDSVDNQYDISIGKTPPRKESKWFTENQQDIPWASIKDMGDAGVYINETSEFLTNEAIKKFNIRVIPKNNVILSFKLTVGRVAILQQDMCTNEAIAHFVPKKDDLDKSFTYCLLKSIRYESLSSTSSIATAVNSKIIKAMQCIFPSKSLLIAFNDLCNPIFNKIETNVSEIETLISLRDTLLPKLISGELKIPDAENIVKEAGI
jgi:type I restriction enzyme S subunit